MEPDISVKKVTSAKELDIVLSIRRTVFVEEQHCPAELELSNEEISHHFMARCAGQPCGAARWRQTDKGYKLERFAVLPAFRNQGVGKKLVAAVLADLPADKRPIYLNAQVAAEPFYAALGFVPQGDRFEEAGIMHQQMRFVSPN